MTKKEIITKYLIKSPFAQTKDVAEACECSRRTVREVRAGLKLDRRPEILILDIETLPMEVFTWGLKQYAGRLPIESVIKDWCIVSWSAKWLFDDKVMGESLTPLEATNRDDWRILEELWHLFEEADILIGHNLDRFDAKKANARFIVNGRGKPLPYQTVDTLKQSQKHFEFSSHKLNWLSQLLINKKKLDTKFELWARCSNPVLKIDTKGKAITYTTVKDQSDAIDEMLEYNKNDVLLTEEVYIELRPWMTSHPNLGLYVETDEEVCPLCMSSELKWLGYYITPANRFRSFRCECGAIGRARKSDVMADERQRLTISVAR